MICLYTLYITSFTVYHVRAYVHTCAHRSSGFATCAMHSKGTVREVTVYIVARLPYAYIMPFMQMIITFIFMPPLPAFYVKLN